MQQITCNHLSRAGKNYSYLAKIYSLLVKIMCRPGKSASFTGKSGFMFPNYRFVICNSEFIIPNYGSVFCGGRSSSFQRQPCRPSFGYILDNCDIESLHLWFVNLFSDIASRHHDVDTANHVFAPAGMCIVFSLSMIHFVSKCMRFFPFNDSFRGKVYS